MATASVAATHEAATSEAPVAVHCGAKSGPRTSLRSKRRYMAVQFRSNTEVVEVTRCLTQGRTLVVQMLGCAIQSQHGVGESDTVALPKAAAIVAAASVAATREAANSEAHVLYIVAQGADKNTAL